VKSTRRIRRLHPLAQKALWMGLSAGLSSVATLAARRLAVKVWHVAVEDDPPAAK
jgi:hypothetical protein